MNILACWAPKAILADTYFIISQAAGTDGVTLLNLCPPVYNFIFAVGSMVGLGAATRYAILKAQGDERCQRYFSNAIFCACVLSVPFLLVGIFAPGGLLRLMGGDAGIVALGIPYARIFLMFTPFFMQSYIVSAPLGKRDGGNLPTVNTWATACSMVPDHHFHVSMGLGLAAALATARPSSAFPSAAATLRRRTACSSCASAPRHMLPEQLASPALWVRCPPALPPPYSTSCCWVWRAMWRWRPMAWWRTLRWWQRPSSMV